MSLQPTYALPAPGEEVAAARPTFNDVVQDYTSDFLITLPAYNSRWINCKENIGATGEAVSRVQQALNFCHGESLVQDGQYGAKIKAAVIRAHPDSTFNLESDLLVHCRSKLLMSSRMMANTDLWLEVIWPGLLMPVPKGGLVFLPKDLFVSHDMLIKDEVNNNAFVGTS